MLTLPLRPDPTLRRWWGSYRDRALKALCAVLGVDEDELLARLGVADRASLSLAGPQWSQPRRSSACGQPGRPTRALDRDAIVAALRETGGSVRAVAELLSLPRTTLARYIKRDVPDYALRYEPTIAERHAKLLAESVISPEVARSRAYSTGRRGLIVPIWTPQGLIAWSQIRLDAPPKRRHRYANPRDSYAVIDVSPYARTRVLDPDTRLYVAESPRKADAAVSRGLACVAVQGARLVCCDAEQWRYVGIEGRDVFVVFDSDAATKPDVRLAEQMLARFLRGMGARVQVLRLPNLPSRSSTGLDDYLATGATEQDLLRLPRAPE